MRTETITVCRLPQVLSEETQKRFWSKVEILGPGDCWIWKAGINIDGYGIFHIPFNGKQVQCRAPKVAWVSANKSVVPDGKIILHSCKQQRRCCNPAHLRPGTPRENIHDQIEQGTFSYNRGGEEAKYCKLTREKVLEIRARFASGVSAYRIAKEEGKNCGYIWNIVHRKLWPSV